MTIDAPREAQIPALRRLWQQAFGDSDAFLDGFFATGFSFERCRCLCWNDRCAAALYWFDCQWQGRKLAYVYAVATDEDFRGKGFCRALMEHTHTHLKKQGYSGAILVPGSRELFDLYEKLGYRQCCPGQQMFFTAGDAPVSFQPVTQAQYARLRRQRLPAGGVLQEGPTLAYLATFAGFFAGEDVLFCGSAEGETFYFQEYLGNEAQLPGVLQALQLKNGKVRLPGGTQNTAMYLPLDGGAAMPAYFGLSLG